MTTYPEPLVVRVTGIKKHTVVATRQTKLSKETDWTLVNSVVHYTPAGLEKICSVLGLNQAGLVWPSEAAPADSTAPAQDASPNPQPSTACEIDPSAVAPTPAESPEKNSPVALETPSAPVEVAPPAASAAAGVASACDALAPSVAPVEVCITSVPHNPAIVLGYVEDVTAKGGRRFVTVRVRDNSNFKPGLFIRATKSTETFYHMVGRPPRWRGDRRGFEKLPNPQTPAA